MGSVRPHDRATRPRDEINPTVAGSDGAGRTGAPKRMRTAAGDPPRGAEPDRATGLDADRLDLLLAGTSIPRAVVAALLLTMAAAPFLKGILAGLALAGAAAALRSVLSA